ncbi:MAG TPA: hypothetical protein DCP92_13855 [Nitrospiraceae bacterium]|nr:hypothetical protein [Nitrospiraceae bacterium]
MEKQSLKKKMLAPVIKYAEGLRILEKVPAARLIDRFHVHDFTMFLFPAILFLALSMAHIAGADTINEFTVPKASTGPFGSTTGPDGNLWFAENAGNNIGQIIIDAAITMMPVPAGRQFFVIPPVVAPVINAVPAQAVPIGIGPLAAGGNQVAILEGLGQFPAPVDIYFAISAQAIDAVNTCILTPTGFQTVAQAGLVPWLSNTSGNISLLSTGIFQYH